MELGAGDSDNIGDLGLHIALNESLENGPVDPAAKALMEKQVHMLDLQMKKLRRENDELDIKFLRERLHATLEIGLALLVVAVLLAAGVMLWQASRADGLVIHAFNVPPELAAKGVTGEVLANRLSDSLGEIEAVTHSVREGGALRAVQRQEVKVAIPKTGLSVSELQALMRAWLGHETAVTGDLVQDGERISLTVRVGDHPGVTAYGAAAEIDLLVTQAAEQVLARSEPYRYAVYLDAQNKPVEAQAMAERLSSTGSPTDRAWGYTMWGRLLASQGDFRGAVAKAQRGLALDPKIAATHDNLAAARRLLGHDQLALQAAQDAAALMRRQQGGQDKVSGPTRLATAEGRVQEARADFAGAARFYSRAIAVAGVARASQAAASLPRALAADHDLGGAWSALDDLRGRVSEDALTDAAVAPGRVAMQAGDWAAAELYLRKADGTAALFGPAGAAARMTQIAPYLAITQAMRGQHEAARATLAPTPMDCYACVRARAVVASRSGDAAGAERLFQTAVDLSPDLAPAYLDWGQARLAAGDAAGALQQARKAAGLAPRWSDPLQLSGEALLLSKQPRPAARQFRKAARLSPHWGAPLLREGQIRLRAGDREAGLALLRQAQIRSLTPDQRAELEAALRQAS